MISFLHSFGKIISDLVTLDAHTQMHTHTFCFPRALLNHVLYMHTHACRFQGKRAESHFYVALVLFMNDNLQLLFK